MYREVYPSVCRAACAWGMYAQLQHTRAYLCGYAYTCT